MRGKTERMGWWLPVFLCLTMLFTLAVSASACAAAVKHAFNAELSLTGGTRVSSRDPVPDPGPSHPAQEFGTVCGVAADSTGDTYVANYEGTIDIFDPEGHWLQEIANTNSPCSLAVDSVGTLYVQQIGTAPQSVVRYTPNEYPPTTTTTYSSPALAVAEDSGDLAIDRGNDHLLLLAHTQVEEFASAAETPSGESNPFIRAIGAGLILGGKGLAVDAASNRIFVSSVCEGCPFQAPPTEPGRHVSVVKVFDQGGTLVDTIDASETPAGGFGSNQGILRLGVDEETGELFVADVLGGVKNAQPRVYRFVPAAGGYEWIEDSELDKHFYEEEASVAVSNTGALTSSGTVYVTAPGAPGHGYAFSPNTIGPPIVSGSVATNSTTEESALESLVNPNGARTRFRIDYVDRLTFDRDVEERGQDHGFDHALIAGSGELPSGHQPMSVSAAIGGLSPGTAYYFRTVAENCKLGEPEGPSCAAEGEPILFATYPEAPEVGSCPNDAFRVGDAATLPDCRAYELVTPSDTNGRVPTASFIGKAPLGRPITELSTASGSGLLFMIAGGALPIGLGNGVHDGYQAVRGSDGWQIRPMSPAGFQSQSPESGGASVDHQYWFWATGSASDHGSLAIGEEPTNYLRLPDGAFDLVGNGPLGTDPRAAGLAVSPNAHVLFSSKVPLALGASAADVLTIYDRAPSGALEVLSLKPSGEAPVAGAKVAYQGTDATGSSVVFTVTEGASTDLYLRREGVTIPVTTGTTIFAGLSEDGNRLIYVKEGNIFSFEADSQTTQLVGSGGHSTVVNLSADGSHVYFVSTDELSGTTGAVAGDENLYVWDSHTEDITFIAVLDPLDVAGEPFVEGHAYGLGQWTEGIGANTGGSTGPANDPSRTTLDGRALVFESHANLTEYDSEGNSEVYRYAAYETPPLRCLSCNPTFSPPETNAHLQTVERAEKSAVSNGHVPAHNITPDGQTVFFQTGDPLVPRDVDRRADVYEWRAAGTGGCIDPNGCLALISSGHSAAPNYLYNVSRSGEDVFFATSDQLLNVDRDPTRSIYDARVDGGIASRTSEPCVGEACKAPPPPPPIMPQPSSSAASGFRNLDSRQCKRSQRKVRRNGKVRCVPRYKRHHKRGHQTNKSRHSDPGGAR